MAIGLVTVALANRAPVSVRLLPEEIDAFFGTSTSWEIPMFLIIYAGIVLGLLIGFIWEWIREARLRAEADRAKAEVGQLRREVKTLKSAEKGSADDFMALLE